MNDAHACPNTSSESESPQNTTSALPHLRPCKTSVFRCSKEGPKHWFSAERWSLCSVSFSCRGTNKEVWAQQAQSAGSAVTTASCLHQKNSTFFCCNLTYITFFCWSISGPAATSQKQWSRMGFEVGLNESRGADTWNALTAGLPPPRRKNKQCEWGRMRGTRCCCLSFLRPEPALGGGFQHVPVMMDGLGGKSIHMEMLHHKYLHRAAVSMSPALVLTLEKFKGQKVEEREKWRNTKLCFLLSHFPEWYNHSKLSFMTCCSFLSLRETNYLCQSEVRALFTFIMTEWTQFIRGALPSYTQTLKSQQDSKQSESEFQLQIIIQTCFLVFHERLHMRKLLNRAESLSLSETREMQRQQAAGHSTVLLLSSIKSPEPPEILEPVETHWAASFSSHCWSQSRQSSS